MTSAVSRNDLEQTLAKKKQILAAMEKLKADLALCDTIINSHNKLFRGSKGRVVNAPPAPVAAKTSQRTPTTPVLAGSVNSCRTSRKEIDRIVDLLADTLARANRPMVCAELLDVLTENKIELVCPDPAKRLQAMLANRRDRVPFIPGKGYCLPHFPDALDSLNSPETEMPALSTVTRKPQSQQVLRPLTAPTPPAPSAPPSRKSAVPAPTASTSRRPPMPTLVPALTH